MTENKSLIKKDTICPLMSCRLIGKDGFPTVIKCNVDCQLWVNTRCVINLIHEEMING